MGTEWSLRDAQNQLPDVVKSACAGNPQFICINNHEEAVIISSEIWKALSVQDHRHSFKDALLSIPKDDSFIDNEQISEFDPGEIDL